MLSNQAEICWGDARLYITKIVII